MVEYQTCLTLNRSYRGHIVSDESCRDVYGTPSSATRRRQVFCVLECLEAFGQSGASPLSWDSLEKKLKMAQFEWNVEHEEKLIDWWQ